MVLGVAFKYPEQRFCCSMISRLDHDPVLINGNGDSARGRQLKVVERVHKPLAKQFESTRSVLAGLIAYDRTKKSVDARRDDVAL